MKEIFKKISELLRETPGKSCQDQLKKRIELSPFKVADFTDSLEPECNQCYTDMLIQVVHGDEKRFKTPHKHKDSRVNAVFQLQFQSFHYSLNATHHRIMCPCFYFLLPL